MELNYYGLLEMANNIVKTAFSIGVAILLTIAVAGGKAVSRWISRKQVEKKKDEESVIENYKQHADAATQTEVQQYPMESVRGLRNLGNTCYFDSTMQALVHTNLVFREKLENLGKKEEFVRIVMEFLNAMQLRTSKPYSPNDLHSMFGKKSPKFADYRQHDSHECLRNFLDNVRKEERDSSGAADKRKVLTVVDSVFGGHFITVYICKECETPYHVCEALLDISLPIMIDEKDLAAMNSARGSNRKKSRTVKLQTPKIDDTNKSKLIKSPINKSNAGEDSRKPKPSKTEQDAKLDVALQQNTSDQALQLKSKSETAETEPLPSDREFEVSSTSNDPEARSVQVEAEELHKLNDVVNLSSKNVDLENTPDGKIGDMLKENSLPIPRLFDTELGTVSLDENNQKVENSKTTFGTETDLEEVCKANESDTSEEDNKKAKFCDEEKESRNESGSETVAENVESSCSTTEAVSNLAEKYDVANDRSLSLGYSHEPSISVGTEDNKERKDSAWMKSGARDNPTEIQECNEGQNQSSEKEQHKQREEQQNYDDENDNKKGQDDKETDEDKEKEKEENKEVDDEQHNLKHDQELEQQQDGKEQNKQEQNAEQAQQVHSDENDDKKDDAERETDEAENDDKEEEEEEEDDDNDDEQENLKQDLELEAQHGGNHLLNVHPEKQRKGAEEQQTGQDIRNEEIKEEVGEEKRKPEVEEQGRQDEQVEREDEEQQKEEDKVEGKSELEYQGRKVVKEEGKDNDEDDDKKDDADRETEEDDEEQTGQQKQELGEFEVVAYASETKDSYRETVDKLMTPLSFSSPYLPSDGKAIRKHVTIYDCLMYFTRKEHIHNEYLCNPCYDKHRANGCTDVLLTSATKQTMIFNPPAILTLHLKRFELKPGGSVKRTDMITYGERLDIAPYCSSMCLRNDPPCQNIWYSLYGVVVHHGSTLKSGHYIAYVKIKDCDANFKKFLQEKYFDRDLTREQLIEMMQEKQPGETLKQPGGTWYCMNDSWSHKVQVAEVLNQEAYLLFYERMS